jgi:hypothetical protein
LVSTTKHIVIHETNFGCKFPTAIAYGKEDKGTKNRQIMMTKTLHRKLNIEEYETTMAYILKCGFE